MRDFDTLALYDALAPDERAALDAAIADEPALAEALARWRSLRAGVRADLGQALPDRALLVLYALSDDDDVLTDGERQRLDAARPAIAAAIDRHPGLAAVVRRIREDRDAFDAAWDEAVAPAPVHRMAPDRAAVRRAAPVRPMRWVARIAALVAVVGFGALATWLSMRDAGWETVAGAQTLTLADGSTIELADNALLSVPDDRGREARLVAGNALFRIVRNPEAPFEVTTSNAEVMVLGTTFVVEATDVETEVTLVTGVVTLAPRATPEAAVRLAPGQRSRVLALDAPTAPERADLTTLPFDSIETSAGFVTVEAVARRLAERFGVSITVAQALASEQVSDIDYAADGVTAGLDLLAAALGARVEAEGDGFRILE